MNELPTGWEWHRLDEVASKPQYGWTSAAKVGVSGLPLLRTTDITHGPIDWTSVPRCTANPNDPDRYLLRDGDIVVSRAGSVGVSALVRQPPEAVFASYLMRMRPHDAVIGDYLKLYLQSPGYWRQISNVTDGIAIPNINGSKLGAVRLPIPPREEQRRIVEILEDHLSRLDAADGLLTLQTSRIASLRLASLTKLATEQSAAGVAAVPLGDLGRSDLGKMLDAKRATGEPTPYLRNINVRWGEFDLSDVRSVPLTDTERSRLELCPGDLLVCEGGEPGRCAVWPGSASIMTFQKALHRVRFPRDTANPHYVALMLGQVIRSGRASRLFTGTTIKHLPQEKLRLISIPVPALGVQDDIVRQTESLEDSFGALHASIRAAHTRSSSLRRALLAAAFSGRLTGRDSDLDRAEELVS